jgi:hypothetical protein
MPTLSPDVEAHPRRRSGYFFPSVRAPAFHIGDQLYRRVLRDEGEL